MTAYYSKSNKEIVQPKSSMMSQEEISSFINELLEDDHHIFNIPVRIITKDHTYETSIVTVNDTYLLTFHQERILLDDILSITRK